MALGFGVHHKWKRKAAFAPPRFLNDTIGSSMRASFYMRSFLPND